jgi:uncharacterized DUF497 family protein
VRYFFDPTKNAANLRKHGVSLADGDGVLSDPLALTVEDHAAPGEARWVTIGVNYVAAVMVVVWAPEDEEIRIISVRQADPKERRVYEEGV